MSHTQLIRALVIGLLAGTSAIFNARYFHSLGGWILLPVGLAIQGLALVSATEYRRSSATAASKWGATAIIACCLAVSVYSCQQTMSQQRMSQPDPATDSLTQAIQSLDRQLEALADRAVITAAAPLRQERQALQQRLTLAQRPDPLFTGLSVLLGLLLDAGALFLVATHRPANNSAPIPVVEIESADPTPDQPIQHPGPVLVTDNSVRHEVIALLESGMSQRQIARELGISQSSVSRYKRQAC